MAARVQALVPHEDDRSSFADDTRALRTGLRLVGRFLDRLAQERPASDPHSVGSWVRVP